MSVMQSVDTPLRHLNTGGGSAVINFDIVICTDHTTTLHGDTAHHNYPVVHTYEPETFADLTLTIQGNDRVCYRLHRYKLCMVSTYFDTLLRADATTSVHHIQLPSTFKWNARQLKSFLDLLYNRWDTELQKFAKCDNVNELLYPVGGKFDITPDDGFNGSIIETIDKRGYGAKLTDGTIEWFNTASTVFPTGLTNHNTMYLDEQIQIADYFSVQPLVDTLERVLCHYVHCSFLDLAVELLHVADQHTLPVLRAACIDELANEYVSLKNVNRQLVDRLKPQSLFDVMLRHDQVHHSAMNGHKQMNGHADFDNTKSVKSMI